MVVERELSSIRVKARSKLPSTQASLSSCTVISEALAPLTNVSIPLHSDLILLLQVFSKMEHVDFYSDDYPPLLFSSKS